MGNSKISIEQDLFNRYGFMIGGSDLTKILGYRTAAALNRATMKNMVGVKTFTVAGRKGKYALTKDVSAWLSRIMENQAN